MEIEDSTLGRNLQAFKTALATVKINVFAAKSSDATALSLSTLLGQHHAGRRIQFVKVMEMASVPPRLKRKGVSMIAIQNQTPGEAKWISDRQPWWGIQTRYTISEAETMASDLVQMLEGYPGHVGPGMNKTAKALMVEASAVLNNCQKTLPAVGYHKNGNFYNAQARFIDPETGESGRFRFDISLNQLLGTSFPILPPQFRRASNAESIIPTSAKDDPKHKAAFEIANLVLAEIDGALIRKAQVKAVVSSLMSKYLSGTSRVGGGGSGKST